MGCSIYETAPSRKLAWRNSVRIFDTSTLEEDTPLSFDENGWIYNGLDSCVTLEVLQNQRRYLDEVDAATYAFSLAKQGPVLDMTLRGVRIDQRARAEALASYKEQAAALLEVLDAIAGEGLGLPPSAKRWSSPTQLKDLFYNVLGLPPIRKFTPRGLAPTVDAEALEKLANHFWAEPLCNHILAYRDVTKKIELLSASVDRDGRIRTSFNIAGTDTGRLASSFSAFGTGRNLQNIDRTLRSVFVADEGMILVNIDLEQGDSRGLGALLWNIFVDSHGEEFAGAYLNACESADLHVAVSRMVWPNFPWSEDSAEWKSQAEGEKVYRTFSMRDISKRLGHGSNFRGKPPHMAKVLRLPIGTVEVFQFKYFSAFPAIPEWHKWVDRQLEDVGFLKTLMGRRRFFYGRLKDDRVKNKATAYAPQGGTAEVIDTGMLRIWRKYPFIQLLLQVHDSVLFQMPYERLEDELPNILRDIHVTQVLKRGREFTIPAEAKVGWNWGDVEKDEHGNEVKNLWGMKKWKGRELRDPPKSRRYSIESLLTGLICS
jgi:DNA polymerase-1